MNSKKEKTKKKDCRVEEVSHPGVGWSKNGGWVAENVYKVKWNDIEEEFFKEIWKISMRDIKHTQRMKRR